MNYKLLDSRRKSRMGVDPIAPGVDLIPVVVESPVADLPDGQCRAIRCSADGEFTGVTAAGAIRTVTMRAGELLPVSFISITDITSGSFEAIY